MRRQVMDAIVAYGNEQAPVVFGKALAEAERNTSRGEMKMSDVVRFAGRLTTFTNAVNRTFKAVEKLAQSTEF